MEFLKPLLVCAVGILAVGGCSRSTGSPAAVSAAASPVASSAPGPAPADPLKEFVGFDRNEYPGDAAMASIKSQFAFTGYWLTVPPGAMVNQWAGKRDVLRAQGWGFLLLANGRFEAQIKKAARAGAAAADQGKKDATSAVASAQREGFPKGAIIFLDQEEGGRLTAPQAEYLLAWTEAVAASDYKPGVYASGQPVQEGPGATIDTVQDIRQHVNANHLHAIAIFDAQDACPPAPGCTLKARPLSTAGEPDLTAWQYSQSPRRPDITKSCGTTYATNGNCYAPGFPRVFLDLDAAKSADPSNGR